MATQKPKSEIKKPGPGSLYIVSTPIGNLEDITLRALKILKNVDLIAAENVNHSRRLCNHYGIKTRLTSYHQHNQNIKGPELIGRLKSGSDIALVTSAGTPAVSDPGALLINMAIKEDIKVSPIPGPSAAIAALSVCGLRVDRFLFMGFLSNRTSKRRKDLKELTNEKRTLVLFEAPHRVKSMLADLNEILGDRQVVILRELTKVYEEIKRGSVSSVLKELEEDKIKGEFTVVVAGKEGGKRGKSLDIRIKKRVEKLLKEDKMGVKEIAVKLSQEHGLNYRVIYREGLDLKKGMQQ
ncbi:16S rRNA (cytidine(1402)-2'-O)-methyltransferase [Thermodesulfobacteriota bacterium]